MAVIKWVLPTPPPFVAAVIPRNGAFNRIVFSALRDRQLHVGAFHGFGACTLDAKVQAAPSVKRELFGLARSDSVCCCIDGTCPVQRTRQADRKEGGGRANARPPRHRRRFHEPRFQLRRVECSQACD